MKPLTVKLLRKMVSFHETLKVICTIFLLSNQGSYAEDNSLEASDESWDSVLENNPLVLVGFFAPWYIC